MATSKSLDLRIIQDAQKHEGMRVERAVRVQHVGAELAGHGNALRLVAREPLPIFAFPLLDRDLADVVRPDVHRRFTHVVVHGGQKLPGPVHAIVQKDYDDG